MSREYEGEEVLKAGGNGFEGIAWHKGIYLCDNTGSGFIILLNQDDPTSLIWVEIDDIRLDGVASVTGFYPLPQRNSGELFLENKTATLWVVNSWLNTFAALNVYGGRHGKPWPVERWEVLPGMAQEGLTFDPQGRMWIGQDIGGVARYVRGE